LNMNLRSCSCFTRWGILVIRPAPLLFVVD